METRIATDIDTALFYSIIKYLTKNGWRVSLEYSTRFFDKGIDYDIYQLENNGKTILFGWTNWFGGEIKTSSTVFDNIEQQLSIKFKFGVPEFLKKENFVEEMKEFLDFK